MVHICVQQVTAAASCCVRMWADLADKSQCHSSGCSQRPRILQVYQHSQTPRSLEDSEAE